MKIKETANNITVEQAEAVITFCANHGSEIAYHHKDGKIFCEMIFSWENPNLKENEKTI